MISVYFQSKPLNITVILINAPTTDVGEVEVDQFCEDLQQFLALTPKTDVLFIIGDWSAKVGSQKVSGTRHKFDFGVEGLQGQRLTVLFREHASHRKHASPTIHEKALHMDITR